MFPFVAGIYRLVFLLPHSGVVESNSMKMHVLQQLMVFLLIDILPGACNGKADSLGFAVKKLNL